MMTSTVVTLTFLAAMLIFSLYPAMKIADFVEEKFELNPYYNNALTIFLTIFLAFFASLFLN